MEDNNFFLIELLDLKTHLMRLLLKKRIKKSNNYIDFLVWIYPVYLGDKACNSLPTNEST